MRLTNLIVRFRRDRDATVDAGTERRRAMTLEAINRPAQSRSLRAVLPNR